MSQPNRTKTALLGFLSWGPMSGYDVRQLIEGSIANFWSEGYHFIWSYPRITSFTRTRVFGICQAHIRFKRVATSTVSEDVQSTAARE